MPILRHFTITLNILVHFDFNGSTMSQKSWKRGWKSKVVPKTNS